MKEKISCKKCGAIYELSFTKTTQRDRDSISCEICSSVIFRWNEAKIFSAKLVWRP